jgi:hypothetical protein
MPPYTIQWGDRLKSVELFLKKIGMIVCKAATCGGGKNGHNKSVFPQPRPMYTVLQHNLKHNLIHHNKLRPQKHSLLHPASSSTITPTSFHVYI